MMGAYLSSFAAVWAISKQKYPVEDKQDKRYEGGAEYERQRIYPINFLRRALQITSRGHTWQVRFAVT
jgi:hypothetical protein